MIALKVCELIEKLSEIENKDLEVWVRGDNMRVIPCDEVSISDKGDYLLLSNHITVSVDDFLKGIQK